jgi:CheY-like chemotaxis protein
LTETSPSTSATRRKVLIVDDQSTNIQVLHAALRGGAYLIQFATSGQQGLDLARRSLPDVVLLDVHLPDLDGIEVCRRLHDDPATAASLVALISGSGEDDDVARGMKAGAVDFLIKPIAPELLRRRVELLVELKGLRELTGQAPAAPDALSAAPSA